MNVKGFHVNFLGDSITYGVGVSDIPNCRYDNRIANMLGLSRVSNHSINGSRLAHQTVPSAKPWYDLCFCGGVYYLMQYLRETYTTDGLHFNDEGHALIAQKLKALIESIETKSE